VSEQPSQASQSSYNRSMNGTPLSDRDELYFRMASEDSKSYETLQAQRQVEQTYAVPAAEREVVKSPVAEAHDLLIHLHQARVESMRPEDTPFLRDKAA